MIETSRIALNRIVCPGLEIEAFLELAAAVGLSAVELRNDLPGRGSGGSSPTGAGITDGRTPAEVRLILERLGLRVLTINALQKFNLAERLDRSRAELEDLLGVAAALGCPAIVLCPNNDPADRRSPETRRAATVECLRALRPLFERSGLLGYVEPLGFAESSLASLAVAAGAIHSAGGDCYRLVWDTFHHYLGPDEAAGLEDAVPVSLIGLVHVSGVEVQPPAQGYRDEHRVLPSSADRMGSREQVARLGALGYRGPVSFEPFSPAVQNLDSQGLQAALRESLEYLSRGL
jgi:2-keto-myo-inositol isomerase